MLKSVQPPPIIGALAKAVFMNTTALVSICCTCCSLNSRVAFALHESTAIMRASPFSMLNAPMCRCADALINAVLSHSGRLCLMFSVRP
uniref:Uncharacterized protein n=1 Tax=Anguilla anguilla TaxID=7936 RepID=A0A0E9X5E5_ANGAN